MPALTNCIIFADLCFDDIACLQDNIYHYAIYFLVDEQTNALSTFTRKQQVGNLPYPKGQSVSALFRAIMCAWEWALSLISPSRNIRLK